MSVMTMAPTTTRDTLATVAARNIRTLMALRGISQVQLAEQLAISQTAVSKRLRGVTPFDLNDLERFAQVLDVRPIDLLSADLVKLPRRDSNLQPAGQKFLQFSKQIGSPISTLDAYRERRRRTEDRRRRWTRDTRPLRTHSGSGVAALSQLKAS